MNKLRVSEDEMEVYAIVTKVLGNNMFHCVGIDNVTRLGHIRGKFTGRGKRDNMVLNGVWILVGLREWSESDDKPLAQTVAVKKKLSSCDLLEVYNDGDKSRLMESQQQNWSVLSNNDVAKEKFSSGMEDVESFAFATDKEIERNRLIDEINSETKEKMKLVIPSTALNAADDDAFDLDDI